MSILNLPSDAEATGLPAEIYADDIRSTGHVPSHTKALSLWRWILASRRASARLSGRRCWPRARPAQLTRISCRFGRSKRQQLRPSWVRNRAGGALAGPGPAQ